jgi:hypothetical protein
LNQRTFAIAQGSGVLKTCDLSALAVAWTLAGVARSTIRRPWRLDSSMTCSRIVQRTAVMSRSSESMSHISGQPARRVGAAQLCGAYVVQAQDQEAKIDI